MNNYAQTKKLEKIIVSCMLLLVAVVVVAVYSFVALGKVREKNAKYDELIARLQAEQAALQEDIDYIGSPEYLEELAVNNLGMVKDGEKIYIYK